MTGATNRGTTIYKNVKGYEMLRVELKWANSANIKVAREGHADYVVRMYIVCFTIQYCIGW